MAARENYKISAQYLTGNKTLTLSVKETVAYRLLQLKLICCMQ